MNLKDLDFSEMSKEDRIAFLRAKLKPERPSLLDEKLPPRDLKIFLKTINSVGIDEWVVIERFNLPSINDLTGRQYATYLQELNAL